jgi:hypothetical protein
MEAETSGSQSLLADKKIPTKLQSFPNNSEFFTSLIMALLDRRDLSLAILGLQFQQRTTFWSASFVLRPFLEVVGQVVQRGPT